MCVRSSDSAVKLCCEYNLDAKVTEYTAIAHTASATCGRQRRLGVVVRAAAFRFLCCGLRLPLGACFTVTDPSVQVTGRCWPTATGNNSQSASVAASLTSVSNRLQ